MSSKAEMDSAKGRKGRVTSKGDESELLQSDSGKRGRNGLEWQRTRPRQR